MKNIKRIFSALCFIILLLSFSTGLTAFALEKTVSVTSALSTAALESEDTLTQTIGFADAVGLQGGIRAFKLEVEYNENSLVASEVTAMGTIDQSELDIYFDSGKVVILYSDFENSVSPASVSGDVLMIDYEIKEDSKGAVLITISSGETEFFLDCSYPDSNADEEVVLRNVIPDFPHSQTVYVNEGYFYTDIYEKTEDFIGVPFLDTDIETFLEGFIPLNNAELSVQNVTSGMVGTGMLLDINVDNTVVLSLPIAVKGDMDGDGQAGTVDLVHIKKGIVEDEVYNNTKHYAADTEIDDIIDTYDIIYLKRIILGLVTQ